MTNQLHAIAAGAALTLCLAAAPAAAADFTISGSIGFHNDVVEIDFSLAAPAAVRLWSDSWQAGVNFDPVGTLWAARVDGSDFDLVAESDDGEVPQPGMGAYDFGLALANLPAGSYRLTVTTAFNFALSTALSGGFAYGGETPIPLADWTQPSADINFGDQKGGFWRVQLSGVDQAVLVPEPGSWALMALGLGALLARRGAVTRRA